MDSAEKTADYDYIITDANGSRKVKDGVESPMSADELKEMRREHKDSGCKECAFVQTKEILLSYIVDREDKLRAAYKPRFYGKFTMIGWVGHSSFYLFKCRSCGEVAIDYPHGYRPGGYCYIRCDECRSEILLKEKEHYQRDGMALPSCLEPLIQRLGFKKKASTKILN